MPEESVKVFYGYSHEDKEIKRQLDRHLRPLSELNTVHWADCEILPGQEWASEIKKNLNTADIILLLISSDFMNSAYCCEEMDAALARHDRGEALVVPIILRPVDWQEAPFSKLQVLPTDGVPITRWPNTDEAYVDVRRGIRKAIDGVQGMHEAKKYRDKANEQFLQHHYENAIEYYSEALRVLPQNPSFNQNRSGIQQDIAEALLKLNKAREALEAYEVAIRLNPDNIQLYSRKGDILFEQKRFSDALVAYEIALHKSLNLNDSALYRKKGDTLLNLARWLEAIDSYKNVINRMPAIEETTTIVQVYANMSEALFRIGKLEEALGALAVALGKDADHAELWRRKGEIYCELKHIDEAQRSYERAITLKPDNPYFHKEYGDILLQLKRFSEAREQYNEAIRLKPDFGYAYNGRSQALNAMAKEAYEESKRLIQLAQKDEEQFRRLKTRQDQQRYGKVERISSVLQRVTRKLDSS